MKEQAVGGLTWADLQEIDKGTPITDIISGKGSGRFKALPPLESHKFPRRKFLAFLGTTLLGTALGAPIAYQQLTNPSEYTANASPKNQAATATGPDIAVEPTVINYPEFASQTRTGFAALLFPLSYTTKMMETIKNEAAKEAKSFLRTEENGKKRYEDGVLPLRNVIKDVIADPRLEIKPEDREDWTKIVELVIMVESGGDILARSNVDALGVMQVRADAIKRMAKKLNITIYDPFSAKDNILIGTRYLLELQRSFPTFETAFAAYNIGEGTMINAIRAYLLELREDPAKIDRDFATMGIDGISPTATYSYIQRYSITLADLEQSPGAREALKRAGIRWQELDDHPMRAFAALQFVDLPAFKELFGDPFLKPDQQQRRMTAAN